MYLVYGVLGVWCTRGMLHSMYGVLSVCCTRGMLYSMYAVLGVCCTSCHSWSLTQSDREGWLNFVCCDDGIVVDEEKRDGRWGWERCGAYKPIWEIGNTTCLIEFIRPRICVITYRIGPCTCRIVDCQLTSTQYSLKSQFLGMISHHLISLSFSWLTLPSPKITQSSHPSRSVHAMIMS